MARRSPRRRRRPARDQKERLLQLVRILAGYACAGVDQEPNDTRLCGKCGPCEANAFLREIGDR